MNIIKLIGGPMDGMEAKEPNTTPARELTYASGDRYDTYTLITKEPIGESDTELIYRHTKTAPIRDGKPIAPKRIEKKETKCSTCGKPVIFARTVNWKTMPVEPDETGNISLVHGTAYVMKKGEDTGTAPRYVSHVATCPNAGKHRRKK